MRQSPRRGVPKMLFMARSMARLGRCCQLDCPRADGLFTLLLWLLCSSSSPCHCGSNRLPSGTHRRNSLRQQGQGVGMSATLGQEKNENRQRQRMATTKSMEFFHRVSGLGLRKMGIDGGNRVWPWFWTVSLSLSFSVLSSKTINSARGFLRPKPRDIFSNAFFL